MRGFLYFCKVMLKVILQVWNVTTFRFESRTEVLTISDVVSEYITTTQTYMHTYTYPHISTYIRIYVHSHT